MALFPNSGRIVSAESIAARPLFVAWGLGDGTWLTPPEESVNATALMNEIGRRVVQSTAFVVPDVDGLILTPTGNYTLSGTPTNHLMISATFEFSDATSAVVREVAVFVGAVINVGTTAPGQLYFTPSEMVSNGRLLQIENVEPIFRSPAIRETFSFIIDF